MKRAATVVFAACVMMVASAHVGSPDMVFDGLAGAYPVRVVVRPPDVVPGIAEVIVRVRAADVQRVSVRPVFWRAGAKGAPSADEIKRVPGTGNVYTGQTWLMSRGSYSVYVIVDGARGSGTAIVPVNAFATGRLPLSPALGAILIVLGLLLVAGMLTIIRAAVGESLIPPGETFSAPQRRRANLVTAVAAPVLALLVFGGAAWWNSVDADYQRTMFRPPAAETQIDTDATHRTLHLTVRDTAAFRSVIAPLVPDHGKMMHLFLVSRRGFQSFSHLHPVQTDSLQFTTELPWAPAGPYLLFGDFVLENGTSLTVSKSIDIPPAPGLVTPSDSDDSWDRTAEITPLVAGSVRLLSRGYTMSWDGAPLAARQPVDLKFTVRDSSGAVAPLEPYLGMAAHAVIVDHDASVFVHLHPMGTVATVSQTAFALRDEGDTTRDGRLPAAALQAAPMPPMAMAGTLSFPYEFPKPGRFRIWVQVKARGQVMTGAFDATVR
ncbi:MAG TPA: hypothetical protein VHV78_02130 [Gemmatimonadaceae bacterium]|jgi:hypothetical protein|nr:hypothetical protein [Gemmatimonadaceae bacterium]